MSTVLVVEDEIYDENYGSWWWVFLITGTLWLILSLIMFRFDSARRGRSAFWPESSS